MGTANHSNDNGDNNLVEERRKFIRLDINVEIRYSLMKQTPAKLTTSSRNISAGGIRMLADEKLNKGDILKLEILLSKELPIVDAVGRVCWVKSFSVATEQNMRYDIGVEFIEIKEEDRKQINKYVFSLR